MTEPANLSALVVDNVQRQRFELATQGSIVFADYQLRSGQILITHVDTPPALRSRGLASILMRGLVDQASKRGLKIIPICSYAQDWMQKNTH
jgi:predicted GNAT family acetyltransferase